MAGWLNSQKRKQIHDIRDFIPVHGKILKPSIKSNTRKVDRAQDVSPNVKQSTLNFENFQPHSKSRRRLETGSNTVVENTRREKVPASTFSTGVRKKVSKHPCAHEDEPSRDRYTCSKESVIEPTDSVAQLHDKRTRHHSKRSVKESIGTSIKHRNTVSYTDCKKTIGNDSIRKRKVLGDETNKVVVVNSNATESFLSSRKKRKLVHNENLLECTTGLPRCREEEQAKEETVLKKQPTVTVSHDVEQITSHRVAANSDDDEFIDTEELLAELSNCEKIVL